MKNLKKVLALVVALTMVLGTVAFAGYTDVADDAAEYTAVSTLSSLDILNGYEDGSFKPDGDITRAEFCAVVCRALGASVSGNAVTGFSDVASDHWASGYIAYVAGQKIVNGMGDGTFAPDANVTFEQAVKMLVVALGFEPMAAQKGGYPTGYMVIANTYEMTKGINVADQTAPASRGVVAQLTYNALDIPMMEQTGFGSQTEYTIQDGTNNKAYKTLLTGLDVAKLDGVILTSSRYESKDASVAKDQVVYRIDETYDNADWEDRSGNPLGGEKGYTLKLAEGVNANDYFGVASTIYVKEITSSKKEIIAIMPGADSEIVKVALEDLDEATDDTTIVYYPSASSTKISKYRLASKGLKFYYNYDEVDSIDKIIKDGDKLRENADVEITLIENSGDSNFDMVIAKEYNYDTVDEVEVEKDRFSTKKEGKNFTFDFEDDEKEISIVNANGEAITLADFKEDDTIAYLVSGKSTNSTGYDWIEIINLGESSVTGTVDQADTETSKYYVDGTEYINVSGKTINLGDEGVFYLTKSGKIFDVDTTASASSNYGYILNAAKNKSGFTDAWQVKLLTKDDGIKIYTVRDGIKYDGIAYDEDGTKGEETEESIPLKNFENKKFDNEPATRVITYKLDSNGLIREIKTVKNSTSGTEEYKADSQKLGKALEDDTVIFNIGVQSETGAYAADINYLVDEVEYKYIAFKNAIGEFDCVVITEGGSPIDYTQGVAIVTSVTKTTLDDATTEALKVSYYTADSDDVASIVIADDLDISLAENCEFTDVKPGAIMMFADNGEGTASAYTVLAWASTAKDKTTDPYDINEDALKAYTKGNDKDNGIVGGYIRNWTSNNGKRILNVVVDDNYVNDAENGYKNGDAIDELVLGAGVNLYTFSNKSSKSLNVIVGDWQGTDSIDAAFDADGDKVDETEQAVEATYFLAFTVDGDVADFITFSQRKTVTVEE